MRDVVAIGSGVTRGGDDGGFPSTSSIRISGHSDLVPIWFPLRDLFL